MTALLADLPRALADLHLLRPTWLWALLALPLLLAGGWWHRRRASAWREAVDPHLLPHLLDVDRGGTGIRVGFGLLLGALAYALAVLALAGPSWRQVEQPLWQGRTPLVIALDLSSASTTGDTPPSRLARARAKLATLLEARDGGQVGLVVYAADAFTVAPLTDDAANVALFLDSLQPSIMPVDGQRPDRAIEWSAALLRQAGFGSGRILLLTNHGDAEAAAAAARARGEGFRVSVLGLGTVQGAPYRMTDGSLARSRLDGVALARLVDAGGGTFAMLSDDGADLTALQVLQPEYEALGADAGDDASAQGGRQWEDSGYWLLPPLMLLGLLAFRRGAPVVALVLCLGLGWSVPAGVAQAGGAQASGLWRRDDQAAYQQMLRAQDAYRQGEFERAATLYGELADAEAQYNQGNALAKAGRYPEAVEAYEQALRQAPGMADAVANKQAVEDAMRRQRQQGGDQGEQGAGNQGAGNQGGQSSPQQGPPGQGGQGQGEPGRSGPPAAPSQGGTGDGSAEPSPQSDRKPPDAGENAGAQPPPEPSPSAPADAGAQQAADAAQRERARRALQQAGDAPQGDTPHGDGQDTAAVATPEETAEQRERRITNEAWLRRVPDDPGGLLREKFRIEHERRRLRGGREE